MPDTPENHILVKKYKINVAFAIISSSLILLMFFVRFSIEENLTKTLFVLPLASIIYLVSIWVSKKIKSSAPMTSMFFLSGLILLPIRIISTGGITSSVVVWGAAMPSLFIFISRLRTSLIFSFLFFIELFFIAQHEILGLPILQIEPRPITHFAVVVIGIMLVMFFAVVQELNRINNERVIMRLEKRNAQNKKMASLGKMAGGIAHEINNPLAVISGASSILSKLITNQNLDNKDKIIKQIEKIQNTSHRISQIISSLLLYARQNNDSHFQVHNLNQMVRMVMELEKEKAENMNIKCELIEEDQLNITCVQIQIEQLILNLVSNAKDAIHELDEKWVKVTLKKDGNFGVLSVKDSGQGIHPEIAEKIMDPFYTTKDVGKGTGLGLNLCLGIAEQHEGLFYLNSESKNTEFIVKFPLTLSKSLKEDLKPQLNEYQIASLKKTNIKKKTA